MRALSIAMALIAAGCSNQAPRFHTTISRAEMREKESHNRERLAGIDAPHRVRNTWFGVDVTGQSPVKAVFMVIRAIPSSIYRSFHQESPGTYVAQMEDSKNADRRREGIYGLMKYRWVRQNPIYSKRFDQIATDANADYTVRAAAVRAMNYSRTKVGHATFVDLLDDPQPAVRLEAAKALANIPDDAAISKLIAHLSHDDSKDVRIACADALRNYRTPEVARTLIDVLQDRDFGVAFKAREGLIFMTGHNFRFDQAAWLNYFTNTKQPFYSPPSHGR